MADPQQETPKPYTTPKGYKPPTIGEQWRYVSVLRVCLKQSTGSIRVIPFDPCECARLLPQPLAIVVVLLMLLLANYAIPA